MTALGVAEAGALICLGATAWLAGGFLADWLIGRCTAFRPRHPGEPGWGRCLLRRGHSGVEHMLERDDEQVWWSTKATDVVKTLPPAAEPPSSFMAMYDDPALGDEPHRPRHRRNPRPSKES